MLSAGRVGCARGDVIAGVVGIRHADKISAGRRKGETQVGIEADCVFVWPGRVIVEGQLHSLRIEQSQVGTQTTHTVERCVDIKVDNLSRSHYKAVKVDVDIRVDGSCAGDGCGRDGSERGGFAYLVIGIDRQSRDAELVGAGCVCTASRIARAGIGL